MTGCSQRAPETRFSGTENSNPRLSSPFPFISVKSVVAIGRCMDHASSHRHVSRTHVYAKGVATHRGKKRRGERKSKEGRHANRRVRKMRGDLQSQGQHTHRRRRTHTYKGRRRDALAVIPARSTQVAVPGVGRRRRRHR